MTAKAQRVHATHRAALAALVPGDGREVFRVSTCEGWLYVVAGDEGEVRAIVRDRREVIDAVNRVASLTAEQLRTFRAMLAAEEGMRFGGMMRLLDGMLSRRVAEAERGVSRLQTVG